MDPYISTFTFSNDIKHFNDGQTQRLEVIDPQNVFRPPFIPGTFSFAVTFGVLAIDPDTEHKLKFIMKSPNGTIVTETPDIGIGINPSFDSTILPKEANGFIFNMDFRNLAFREKGKYVAHVYIDDRVIGNFPVLVYPQEIV